MTMNLFLPEEKLVFGHTKTATPVPENQDEWTHSILKELSKQAPYAMEYAPSVKILHSDDTAGTALGLIILTNATQSGLTLEVPVSRPPKRVLVPLIIKNNEMSPLDLIMSESGKVYPLTEVRLREALFRPETFEMVSKDLGDNSIRDIFGIGESAGIGTMGSSVIEGNGMKYSSAQSLYPLLSEVVSSTALRPDIDEMTRTLCSDSALTKQASKNTVFLGALQVLSGVEKTARSNTLDLYRVVGDIHPTHVMQFGSNRDGTYWAKSASRDHYSPTKIDLTRRDLIKMASEDVAVKVDKEGTVTVSERALDSDALAIDKSEWGPVKTPGIYKVRTIDGRDLTGWVLPNLVDFDGIRLPLSVFTNGSESAVQNEIVGAPVASGTDLPSVEPQGTGVFFTISGGKIDATVPVAVLGSSDSSVGKGYAVRTLTGDDRTIRIVPGVKKLVSMQGEISLPDTTQFLSVDKESAVALVDRVGGLDKTAAHTSRTEFVVYGDGDYFSSRSYGIPKLAASVPSRMSYDDAVFTLCAAGCGADEAHQVLKQASYGQGVSVYGVRDVSLAPHTIASHRAKVASASRDVRALRRNLIKEASVLPDATTVDGVLGLQFINSENVRVFIAHIPYFDKCTNLLCELLLASRLGISEIPEYATSRAARSIDEVIQGLRALALRKVTETAN